MTIFDFFQMTTAKMAKGGIAKKGHPPAVVPKVI
jgi:hypothetical protein